MRRILVAIIGIGLSAAEGQAQTPADTAARRPVKLTLDLGFVNAAGNTDLTTLSLGDNLEFRTSQWELKQLGAVVYGRSGDSTTAEQIKITGRVDRKLLAVVHLFVGLTYERNRFAGIGRRFEEFAGVGLRLIDAPRTRWNVDLGSSLNQERSVAAISRDFAALRVATLFRHNFTATAYFEESAETLPNLDNSDDLRVNSETSLVAPLSGRVALKFSYTVKFDNLPEPGFARTDRVFTTAIQLSL